MPDFISVYGYLSYPARATRFGFCDNESGNI
jgi:hypothetical protein